MENEFIDGFASGAQSRQSEIDELIGALEEFYKTWESMADVFPSLNNQPCHIKASKLLKKYRKK